MKAKNMSHKYWRLTLLLTSIALTWTLASTRTTYGANRWQLVGANGELGRVVSQDNPGTSGGTPGAKDKKDDDKKKDAKAKAKKKKDEKKDEKKDDKKPS